MTARPRAPAVRRRRRPRRRGRCPEVAERLRALGYVGRGGEAPPETAAGPAGSEGPPRRWNALCAGEALLQAAAALEAALRALRRGAREGAREPFALSRSGQALVELGRVAEGIARLEKAVASGPRHAESRLALAQALTRAGRPRAAVEHA